MLKKLHVLGAALSASVLSIGSANAALDATVTTAMGTATADVAEVGALILVAAATAFGIRWVKATFF